MKHILLCFCGIMLCFSVQAQVTVPDSPVKRAADSLAAMTAAGYYPKLVFSEMAAQVDRCNVTLCSRSPLPVTMVSFTGERLNEHQVALYWETSEEVNNAYFTLERTLNPTWGFEVVGTVQGAGSTRAKVSYETKDPNSFEVYTYYRLKQVDFDGTFEYSSIIAIKGGAVPFAVAAFPNPAQAKNLAFKVTGLKPSEQLALLVYDSQGRQVFSNEKYSLPEERIIKVNLQNLRPGKYTAKFTGKSMEATAAFIVVP